MGDLAFITPIVVLHRLGRRQTCVRRRRSTTYSCERGGQKKNDSLPLIARVLPLTAYAAYIPSVFSFDPTSIAGAPGTSSGALREAFQLSFNFGYISPLLYSDIAPVLHPCYESLFNIVVSWALLLVGFVSEDLSRTQRVPYTPVAIATAFLTNIVYLPFLAIRSVNNVTVAPVPRKKASVFLRLAESRLLPATSLLLFAASLMWAVFGRPEFGSFDVRFATFATLLNYDVLAHSLALDAIAFCAFQAVLVNDDVRRRGWTGSRCDNAVAAARFIPFFGLCYYLCIRSGDASLLLDEDEHIDGQ